MHKNLQQGHRSMIREHSYFPFQGQGLALAENTNVFSVFPLS